MMMSKASNRSSISTEMMKAWLTHEYGLSIAEKPELHVLPVSSEQLELLQNRIHKPSPMLYICYSAPQNICNMYRRLLDSCHFNLRDESPIIEVKPMQYLGIKDAKEHVNISMAYSFKSF